jgi:hypothetical protein
MDEIIFRCIGFDGDDGNRLKNGGSMACHRRNVSMFFNHSLVTSPDVVHSSDEASFKSKARRMTAMNRKVKFGEKFLQWNRAGALS